MTVMEDQAEMADIRAKTAGDDRRVRLAVRGELDLAAAARVVLAGQKVLTGHIGKTLTIDMSGVTFIDAAGIGALIAIRNHARLNDNLIALTEASPCVLRILNLTGLTAAFTSNESSAPDVGPSQNAAWRVPDPGTCRR
jgi:anti-sigma B factor antagonist